MKKVFEHLKLEVTEGRCVPIGYWPVEHEYNRATVVFYVWWLAPFMLARLIFYNVARGVWQDLMRFNMDVVKYKVRRKNEFLGSVNRSDLRPRVGRLRRMARALARSPLLASLGARWKRK